MCEEGLDVTTLNTDYGRQKFLAFCLASTSLPRSTHWQINIESLRVHLKPTLLNFHQGLHFDPWHYQINTSVTIATMIDNIHIDGQQLSPTHQ